jgi:hypothetical protein
MAPIGVIPVEELPQGYGLIEVKKTGGFHRCYHNGKDRLKNGRGYYYSPIFDGADRNARTESAILVSILRQIHMEGYAEKRNLYIHRPTPSGLVQVWPEVEG